MKSAGVAAGLGWAATMFLCTGAVLATLYLIFIHAPVEAQMGIVQKIFYFHVPSAYAMYVGFCTCGLFGGLYLIKPTERRNALAIAAGEVGLLFCVIVLITGPLWARKAWGVYWTWDPRLTTTLLAGMIFGAHWVLRNLGEAGEAERKFASALAVLGVLDLPIIHYSVQKWRGTHPAVISGKGGGLHPDMYPALFVSFGFFTLLVIALIYLRTRVYYQEEHMQRLAIMLSDQDAERRHA